VTGRSARANHVRSQGNRRIYLSDTLARRIDCEHASGQDGYRLTMLCRGEATNMQCEARSEAARADRQKHERILQDRTEGQRRQESLERLEVSRRQRLGSAGEERTRE